MDRFSRQVLDKLPLAESTLQVLSHALDDDFLEGLFQEHRGASYTKLITFPVLTQLISEALIASKSGRRTFEAAHEAGTLEATVEAAYKKLGRIPIALSTALLNGCSQRVRSLFPEVDSESPLPKSLAGLAAVVVDGKVTKGIPHRLKPLRGKGGGLVGGKGLVAYHLESGLVIGLEADQDGDANDVCLLPGLMPSVRASQAGRRLWIADRQFSFLSTLAEFARENDVYLVRYSQGIPYHRDASRASRKGRDSEGRSYDEEWGWLGKEKAVQRCSVRRITLNRGSKDAIVLVTNLMDADQYPAADLLETYRNRPNIESVFQRITEVLALRRLIGTSPRATVFQLSLCLLLYNVLQLVRSYIASNADKSVDEVSPKKLLEDVRDQLAGCQTVLGTEKLSNLEKPDSAEKLKGLLTERLRLWKPRWGKATRRRNRPAKPKCGSRHDSAFRLLEKAKGQQ
jgi:Transposase DDE domain